MVLTAMRIRTDNYITCVYLGVYVRAKWYVVTRHRFTTTEEVNDKIFRVSCSRSFLRKDAAASWSSAHPQ